VTADQVEVGRRELREEDGHDQAAVVSRSPIPGGLVRGDPLADSGQRDVEIAMSFPRTRR